MCLPDLASEFVYKLNLFLSRFTTHDDEMNRQVESLSQQIARLTDRLSNSEKNFEDLLGRLESSKLSECDIVYLRYKGELYGALSTNIEKIKPSKPLSLSENCLCPAYHFSMFEKPSKFIIISTEEDLINIDKSLTEVCIQVFDHDYRSYSGFTCFLAFSSPSSPLYILDALKFRESIPRLRLLRCGIPKLIHCQHCAKRLFIDFGKMGCCWNFTADEDRYVDWRIRPINDMFISLMFEGNSQIIDKIKKGMSVQISTYEEESGIEQFISENDYCGNEDLLREVLNLRKYLASKSDESLQYVMTDKQILILMNEMPKTIERIEKLLVKVSPVLRRHLGDFALIFRQRTTSFSLEELLIEETSEQAVTERYKPFGNKV